MFVPLLYIIRHRLYSLCHALFPLSAVPGLPTEWWQMPWLYLLINTNTKEIQNDKNTKGTQVNTQNKHISLSHCSKLEHKLNKIWRKKQLDGAVYILLTTGCFLEVCHDTFTTFIQLKNLFLFQKEYHFFSISVWSNFDEISIYK